MLTYFAGGPWDDWQKAMNESEVLVTEAVVRICQDTAKVMDEGSNGDDLQRLQDSVVHLAEVRCELLSYSPPLQECWCDLVSTHSLKPLHDLCGSKSACVGSCGSLIL